MAATLADRPDRWVWVDADTITVDLGIPPQLVQGLLSVAEFLSENSAKNKQEELQQQFYDRVIARLDEIKQNTDLILKELASLKDYIPVVVEDAFRQAFVVELGGEIKTEAAHVAAIKDPYHLTDNEQKELNEDANQILKKTDALRAYGYASWFAVRSGTLAALGLYSLTGPDPAIPKVWMSDILKWLEDAGNPAVPDSLGYACQSAETLKNGLDSEIASYPRYGYVGSWISIREVYRKDSIKFADSDILADGLDLSEGDVSRLLQALRDGVAPPQPQGRCTSFYGHLIGPDQNGKFGWDQPIEAVYTSSCNLKGLPGFPGVSTGPLTDYYNEAEYRVYMAAAHLQNRSIERRRVAEQQIPLSQMFDGVRGVFAKATESYKNIIGGSSTQVVK